MAHFTINWKKKKAKPRRKERYQSERKHDKIYFAPLPP